MIVYTDNPITIIWFLLLTIGLLMVSLVSIFFEVFHIITVRIHNHLK